jgi:hypothetical protein
MIDWPYLEAMSHTTWQECILEQNHHLMVRKRERERGGRDMGREGGRERERVSTGGLDPHNSL